MSLTGSTSRHCYALGCANGGYKLLKWRQAICSVHSILQESCPCPPPFELYPFPTKKKDPEARQRWLQALSRADPKHPQNYLEPSKDQRVCSEHFVNGCKSTENPDPTLKLGHSRKRKITDGDRSERYQKRSTKLELSTAPEFVAELYPQDVTSGADNYSDTSYPYNTLKTCAQFIIFILLGLIRKYKQHIQLLEKENSLLKIQVAILKKKQKIKPPTPSHADSLLKKDSDSQFYTGLDSLALFRNLHNFISPFVKRRWRGLKCVSTKVRRHFLKSPKKFGPKRKLKSEDEFLLTLMWLRLGLLRKDLADRFNISESLSSQIFNSWVTAMHKVLSHLVFWPSKEQIIATKPNRYRHLPDLRAIIDCSEIFIETPKDPLLQAATWSDYKHHNTGKFLIGVAPNSAITFCSNVFNGRASDKSITRASGFLDKLESYDMIQADKGFNIHEECAARLVQLHIPPGKRGQAQMSVAANVKTSRIANLRILVEQVIRRVKSFRIIKYTVPISLVSSLDKIVTVCCALCNLKKPIYKD